MRYRVNLDALSLKKLNKNEEFESNSIVAKNDIIFDEKTS